MKRLVILVLIIATIALGRHFYLKMRKARHERGIARERARQAAAWQKMLEKNVADRKLPGEIGQRLPSKTRTRLDSEPLIDP